jgi:hypothetical protein
MHTRPAYNLEFDAIEQICTIELGVRRILLRKELGAARR